MKKFANFIVKSRKILLIVFALLIVYCVWGMGQINVEYDINSYLPGETDTKKALEIMEDEFTTFETATIMIRNITFEEASALHKQISKIDGVKSFTFNSTPDYYSQSCALFEITFDGDGDDEVSAAAYHRTEDLLKDKDVFISKSPIDTMAEDMQREINFVLIIAIAIIIVVLAFTSQSFAEVFVFLLTFGVAALLNMGTNYWFGTISFISNCVCVILQLALAIDYAIIMSHRFAEEKNAYSSDSVAAMRSALSKAIVEISSSSLTTISGLLALTTMSLGLGADLGLVLAKSILCSMITVFFFMPSIMLLMNKPIEKTKHRNLVPKISFVGKFDVKYRYIIAVLFLVAASASGVLSQQAEYSYSVNNIDTNRPSQTQIAIRETEKVFGHRNQFVILTQGKNYSEQRELLKKVEGYKQIEDAIGISNQQISLNGASFYLTDGISYKQFASLLAADDSIADAIYSAYAFLKCDNAEDGIREVSLYKANKIAYRASLLELADCAIKNDDFILAYLEADIDATDSYNQIKETIQDAEAQLVGENYCRLLFKFNGEVESKETFEFIETLIKEVKSEYPNVIFAGDSMSAYDLDQSFSTDNLKVSILTVLFVFIILIFTFRSFGLPIPLTATIQSAIFINFTYYVFADINVFFFVYLIVSAIQMGATIDYAIVITNRFEELKHTMNKKDAMIAAVNQAFPTILTSGTIMCAAGFLIGALVSNPLIATLGTSLGRGVIISVVLVMTVLPAILYLLDKPISKTKFKDKPKTEKTKNGLNDIIKKILLNPEKNEDNSSKENQNE